jgi:hypothetical protein
MNASKRFFHQASIITTDSSKPHFRYNTIKEKPKIDKEPCFGGPLPEDSE